MKTKTLNLKDVPRSVDYDISKALVDYSVAVCRVRDNNTNTFTPLGSGTFVVRDGMHGILTAHHCLHACNPEVRIGAHGQDTLLLMVTRGRCVILNPKDAREHPLAVPKSPEFGPDLTFIEISSGPKLDLLKAIVSFWNLDEKRRSSAVDLSSGGVCIVNAGFPEVDYETSIVESAIHHHVKHMVFIGVLEDGDLSEHGNWDYIKSSCKYRFSEKLPETFKGVSGGGIWAVRLQVTKDDRWSVRAYSLVGVTFYETEVSNNRRDLRGHFIKTIYETAWN